MSDTSELNSVANQVPLETNSAQLAGTVESVTYRAGTLTYTKLTLAMLVFWLLWGDFCYSFTQIIFPTVLPLTMKSLGASNMFIGIIVSTVPSLMNFAINPIVSFRSDRFRSKWGRRIPFILVTTPLVSLSFIVLGFSEYIGKGLYNSYLHRLEILSPEMTVLIVIGICAVSFQIFYMVIGSTFGCLFNDVVPPQLLTRFWALFRIVGAFAAAIYNIFIFRYAETCMPAIFLSVGILFFVSFLMISLKVKEGHYPPPPNNICNKQGIFASVHTFAVECFTNRFYWYFFLANTFMQMANCTMAYYVFLYKSMGISLQQLGLIQGLSYALSAVLTYPAGAVADRIHPIRIVVISTLCCLVVAPISLIYLHPGLSQQSALYITIVLMLINLPLNVAWGTAIGPTTMLLLPKERFGQFSSANAMVNSLGLITGGMLAGGFMDIMKNLYDGNTFYYRYLPFWAITVYAFSSVFILLAYRKWKEYGGQHQYIPPVSGTADA